MFFLLLANIVNVSNNTKSISLKNQQCMVLPPLINLNCDKYGQRFHNCLFAFNLDRCMQRFNTLNDLSNKLCVPDKTEDLNFIVFKMII